MTTGNTRMGIIIALACVSIAGVSFGVWRVISAKRFVPVQGESVQTADIEKAVQVVKSRKPFGMEGTVDLDRPASDSSSLQFP